MDETSTEKIEGLMPQKEFWLSAKLGSFKDMTLKERAEVAVCYTELGPKLARIFKSEEFQEIVTDPKVREMFLSGSFLTPLARAKNSLISGDMKYEELEETFQILKTSMERLVRGWENPEYTFKQTKPLNFSNFERYWKHHEEFKQLMSRLPRQLTAGAHNVQFYDGIPPEFEMHVLLRIIPAAIYRRGKVGFFPQLQERYRYAYYSFLHEVVGHGNDITSGAYCVLPLRKHLEYYDRWTKLLKEDPTVLTENVRNAIGGFRQAQEDWADSLAWFLENPKTLRRASSKRYEFFKGYITEVSPDFDEFQYAKEVNEILEKIEPRTIIGKVKKTVRERRKK
jgi:hypothetical protein